MSGKIKVIHIADKFGVKGSSVHGVSRLFSWWFPRFDRSRYDVKLVGLRKADKAVANLREAGVDVITLDKGKFDFTTITALRQLVQRERPGILHLHGYGATNFGRVAARLAGVKTIVHEHFVDPAMPGYQGLSDRMLARYTDYGIAVSHSVRDFMVNKRHIPGEKVEVIFNGAPLEEFEQASGAEIRDEREKWGIPEGYRTVATIGRLDEQKGNQYFVEAAAQVLERTDDVKFMIVGDGPLLAPLQEQCRALGIEENVIFTGFQKNIPLLQSAVDIQVFPSLWEGTPLTLFEAMAMGKAIVSTDVDGLGEVLEHEETALVVAAREPAQLAHGIERLLGATKEAERLMQNAKEKSQDFSIAATVGKIQDVYETLWRNSGRRR